MMTHKPLNLNDEDLADGMCRTGRPMSQPTHTSYGLFRIQLAEISRHLADRKFITANNCTGPSYEVVIDIDTEVQTLLNGLPPFFSMPVSEVKRVYNLELFEAANISRQGHIFRSLCYGQRCRLHLSFLGRGYTDPNYALSRDACVESARRILQLEIQSETSGISDHNQYKPLGLIMGVFIACIILLMDLCHSKGSPHHERQREDLSSAFRLLEDVKHESKMAERLITSMTHILHKHQISPPKIAQVTCPLNADASFATAPSVTLSTTTELYNVPTTSNPNDPSCSVGVGHNSHLFDATNGLDFCYFPDLAQSLDQGMVLDNFNWDDLFNDLGTSFA
jgi:hypothetical protein